MDLEFEVIPEIAKQNTKDTGIRLGNKAMGILQEHKLLEIYSEELSKIFASYNLQNSRYKRCRMRYENIKELLRSIYTWTKSIPDEHQKICAQINSGLVVVNKYYFIIWVERFKGSIGSHSTINNLLNHIGCYTVRQELDTQIKHETILSKFLPINRNWSVRLCAGLFDEFFHSASETETEQQEIIDLENVLKKPRPKRKENEIILHTSTDDQLPSLLDSSFDFREHEEACFATEPHDEEKHIFDYIIDL